MDRHLRMLLDTLGASLLGSLLTGKDTIRAGSGTMRAGEGTFLMLLHPLTNFEIQNYYQKNDLFKK